MDKEGYLVNKKERRDLVKIIYGWLLRCFLGRWPCASSFKYITCSHKQKDSFVTFRHNNLNKDCKKLDK